MRVFISAILILCSSFAFVLHSEVSRAPSSDSYVASHAVVAVLPFRLEARPMAREFSNHSTPLFFYVPSYRFDVVSRFLPNGQDLDAAETQLSLFHVWARGPPLV